MKKHIDHVEMVQRRAIRVIDNFEGISTVNEARENIELEILEHKICNNRKAFVGFCRLSLMIGF